MTYFARFLEALKTSRQLEADRVIRHYWHLVEQACTHEEKQNVEAARNDAAASSQSSFIARVPL